MQIPHVLKESTSLKVTRKAPKLPLGFGPQNLGKTPRRLNPDLKGHTRIPHIFFGKRKGDLLKYVGVKPGPFMSKSKMYGVPKIPDGGPKGPHLCGLNQKGNDWFKFIFNDPWSKEDKIGERRMGPLDTRKGPRVRWQYKGTWRRRALGKPPFKRAFWPREGKDRIWFNRFFFHGN